MKKGALCILVLFLLAGFFPAARASVSGGFEYRLLDDGTAVITGYTGDEAKPVIPSAIDGIKVTEIGGRAFANCRKLSSVKIPEGVRAIGDFAFWDCRGLISASIPGTVQTISFCAFSGCEKLRSVMIGEGVKKIGEEAFSFCYGLTSVKIPGSVTEIAQNAFLRCETLASVNIPNQARLNGNPFTACYRLKTISVSSAHPRYTLVDGVLFDKVSKTLVCYPGMRRDRTYEIPAGTEEIGAYAFGGGRNLKKVTVPDSVKATGEGAFKWTPVPQSGEAGLKQDAAVSGGVLKEKRYLARNGTTVEYYLYIPETAETAEKQPILIYFHGVGDIMERHHGLGELIRAGEISPKGIVIMPQAINRTVDADFHTRAYQDAVIELAKETAARLNGDMNRLSVSGHSDGGVTAYQIVNGHPGIFAACAPISGVGNMGEGIKQTDLWVFQGAKDKWVKKDTGLRIAIKCKQAGCNARYYLYPEEGHDIQTMVYQDTFTDENGRKVKLIDWLMSKKLKP